tara:strand:- start:233 stop:814 length:582 start_codon:yes stop_codon:yes gene_type:complete
MSQIKLKHSGGNSVIIAAPDSNPASDRTLKLPSNADGTVLTTTNPKAGNIIQVVSAVATSTVSSADVGPVDTGLSGSITPSATSSKILVIVSQSMLTRRTNGNGWSVINYDLVRGSTVIMDGVDNIGLRASAHSPYTLIAGMFNLTFLDSPNTTSSTTYKTQAGRGPAGDSNMNWKAQDNNSPSTITLLEVAG